uniref:Uncharacterized protein n=1 Tax=Pristionchus pacificus TaxID=54126 RepID=A0A2A6BUJ3_PRIPA|eukprot:PDM69569.1 hypothetical protein PRIPAC_44665 [Pristionchus pacificus]
MYSHDSISSLLLCSSLLWARKLQYRSVFGVVTETRGTLERIWVTMIESFGGYTIEKSPGLTSLQRPEISGWKPEPGIRTGTANLPYLCSQAISCRDSIAVSVWQAIWITVWMLE